MAVDRLEQRIDHAAELGTLVLTLTGGEPLLHPKLDTLVARTASHGMVCTMILERLSDHAGVDRRLNDANLSLLQMSVDNMEPNEFSQKSWSADPQEARAAQGARPFRRQHQRGARVVEPRAYARGRPACPRFRLLHDRWSDARRPRPDRTGPPEGFKLAATYQEMQRTSNKTVFHRIRRRVGVGHAAGRFVAVQVPRRRTLSLRRRVRHGELLQPAQGRAGD
ncbi:MAG: hypothetical protein QM736_25190 [Vicinamibacterales bacterium]